MSVALARITVASRNPSRSAPGRSSSVKLSVCMGSSAAAKRRLLLRAPRAIALTFPTCSVKKVTTASDSPYGTTLTTYADETMRLEAARPALGVEALDDEHDLAGPFGHAEA